MAPHGGKTCFALLLNGMNIWTTIGHNDNRKYFEAVAKNGALAHAYIFYGPEMIGKKMFAEDLFRLLNSTEPSNQPDFKLISPRVEEDETQIYIDDIRELKRFLSFKAYSAPYKFVLINDADRLTEEASNAFLKVLEEPTPNSIIILVTSKSKWILPTISSRCELVKFSPLKREEIDEFLSLKKINKDDKEFVLKMAHGRLGWVVKLLETGDIAGLKKAVEEFATISKQGIAERIQYAKKIYEKDNYADLIANVIYRVKGENIYNAKAFKNLLRLNFIVSQPQYNHRLAIENFLINL